MTDLRNYLSLIKKSGDLKIIKTKVSTKYEIAGITAKVDGSNAVLFENIAVWPPRGRHRNQESAAYGKADASGPPSLEQAAHSHRGAAPRQSWRPVPD